MAEISQRAASAADEADRRARLPKAASACLIGVVLTAFALVWTHPGQALDQGISPEADRGGFLFVLARGLLWCSGDPLVLGGVLAGVVLASAFGGRIRAALAGIVVVVCSFTAARLLKAALPRPEFDVADATSHNSFPSGHVTVVAAIVCTVLFAVPAHLRWRAAVAGAVVVAAVGAATVLVGWHRVSDSVGAVLVVAALGCLVAWSAGRRWV
ncbi:phosphatase PAP2 family protein [Saccharopolyspora gloriosae]|uniref:phosphatase PAP2 family protein n=1 Tax=Saccharopolyspora gloriosae TaxID=455344 RepID=UPI001FB6934D|nr:phosphatase PAP2 family protein [Saccharopolyspora gloriosae]